MPSSRGRNHAYDALHRLIDTEELLGDGPTVARGTSFGYDAVGNRTRHGVSVAKVSETENYVNDTLSNQFQSSSIKAGWLTLQSRALTHGDSGNRASDTASGIALNLNYAMAYDATDRLASVSDGATVLGAYIHNAMGQRVSKTRATGAVTHFLYDLSGRLIAEANGATGITHSEYIAFEGINLAWITTAGIFWVHGDHLDTPQMLTDAAGAQAWGALYAPFGMLLEETGTLDFNLRFPGQYHDAETEFYYNYFRTYDPTSGRYVESDPIGLRGGWNTYGYVGGNPVIRVDPMGLISAGSINPPPKSRPILCKSGQPDCGPPPKLPNYSNADEFPMGPNHGLRFGFGCPKTDRGRVLLDFKATWKKLYDGSFECLNIICLYSRCENGRWRDTGTKIKACGRGLVQKGSLL